MKTKYNVIRARHASSEESSILATFDTWAEADEAVRMAQEADAGGEYRYFAVESEAADDGLPVNIDEIHPMIKE